jgi:hypothetical protein
MACDGDRRRFVLVLEDRPRALREGPGLHPSAPTRLKQLLKTLLHLHGFRCVEAKELPAEGDGPGGELRGSAGEKRR